MRPYIDITITQHIPDEYLTLLLLCGKDNIDDRYIR